MSKLSFRARALDANKSLPVFHEEDVPDLPDIASVNRVVPQMPTGMEKEEETEHHLQRAISAQQIYGGSQRLIIPTPDAILFESDYKQLKQRNVHMPKQLIHVQAFTLEDELPDYDCDEDDEAWLEKYNKKNPDSAVEILELERIIDTLEKSCSSRLEMFTISDAQALLKKDEKVVKSFFDYWKEKRTKLGNNLTPIVRTEKKDGTAHHDPYVAFRRRIEKMQTRKNRKNDESSYEKMLKLRWDLNRACLILGMVKQREEKKRDLLKTTMKILEARYINKDFNGELLHQCYDLLKNRQLQQEQKNVQRPANRLVRETGEPLRKRSEIAEEQRKRHKLLKQQQRETGTRIDDSGTADGQPIQQAHSRIEYHDGPDGRFTFRRKKGVIYHAPRYESIGNWPWTHPVEGGISSSHFSYARTSIQKRCRPIGFARRRQGRGGRINFDRAYTPYDDYNDDVNSDREIDVKFCDRVPPWPHFKPSYDTSSSEDDWDHYERRTNSLWFINDSSSSGDSATSSKNLSYSTQPSSRFRIHPYSNKTLNNHKLQKRSSSSSDMYIFSLANNFKTHNEVQNWILRRAQNNNYLGGNSTSSKLSASARPASTAPSSAIYQLNFPISTFPSTTTVSKTVTTIVSNINNNTVLRTPNHKLTNTSTTVSGNIQTIPDSSALAKVPLTLSNSPRQPLAIVQQSSIIPQKFIPHTTVSTTQGNVLQVQPVVNNVRASKLNIPKGLTLNHGTVVSNGISQPQSMQLAR